jgi:hypothetical protein
MGLGVVLNGMNSPNSFHAKDFTESYDHMTMLTLDLKHLTPAYEVELGD